MVNSTLPRRSGTLKMFFRLDSTSAPRCPTRAGSRRGPLAPSAVGELVALGGRPSGAVRQGQDLDSTACGRDRSLSGPGETVSRDPHGAGQLAPAHDLHQRALVREAMVVEDGRGDLALLESFE